MEQDRGNAVSFRPGRLLATATASAVLVVDEEVGADPQARLRLLTGADGPRAILAEVLGTDARSAMEAPDFALVVATGNRAHVAVRGGLTVAVTDTDGRETVVDGREAIVCAETIVDRVAAVRIAAAEPAGDPGPELPLIAGTVPAAEVTWNLGRAGVSAAAPATDRASTPPAAAPAVVPVGDPGDGPVAAEAEPEQALKSEPETEPAPESEPEPAPGTRLDAQPTPEAERADRPATLTDGVGRHFAAAEELEPDLPDTADPNTGDQDAEPEAADGAEDHPEPPAPQADADPVPQPPAPSRPPEQTLAPEYPEPETALPTPGEPAADEPSEPAEPAGPPVLRPGMFSGGIGAAMPGGAAPGPAAPTPRFDSAPRPAGRVERTVGGGVDYASLMRSRSAGPDSGGAADGVDGPGAAPDPADPPAGTDAPADGHAPATPPGATPMGRAGDHDGSTGSFAAVQAELMRGGAGMPAGAAAPADPGPADGLLSRVCAQGHPNPPHATQCRICQAPLSGDPVNVARPVLGAVRLSTGPVFDLDRDLVLGRRPRVDQTDPATAPRLITLPSPGREISRSHVRIQLDGWHVLAIDLGSTNGTYLRRGGFDDRRLMAGEPQLLADGDELVIEEITVRLEGLP